jgi:dihydroorotate dehydrogenase
VGTIKSGLLRKLATEGASDLSAIVGRDAATLAKLGLDAA